MRLTDEMIASLDRIAQLALSHEPGIRIRCETKFAAMKFIRALDAAKKGSRRTPAITQVEARQIWRESKYWVDVIERDKFFEIFEITSRKTRKPMNSPTICKEILDIVLEE